MLSIANPRGSQGHSGGAVAAPVVSNILTEVFEYLEIPKNYETSEATKKIEVPDVTNRTVGEAIRMLNGVGLKYDVDSSDLNQIVTAQMPVAKEQLNEKSLVKLYLQGNDTRFTRQVY